MNTLLFDIDGTLLLSGGAGNRAMDCAFRELYGIERATEGRDFSGMTDPAILRELFSHFQGRDCTAEEMGQMAEAYLRFLEAEVEISPGFRVLPGIADLLAQLAIRSDVLLGIATGNLVQGASIKLKRAGLFAYFRFGAYGSDSEDRTRIISLATERAKALMKDASDGSRTFVIGDTPLDILAGKRAGALTVAVATGNKSMEELRHYGPSYLFPDFSRPQDLLHILS